MHCTCLLSQENQNIAEHVAANHLAQNGKISLNKKTYQSYYQIKNVYELLLIFRVFL